MKKYRVIVVQTTYFDCHGMYANSPKEAEVKVMEEIFNGEAYGESHIKKFVQEMEIDENEGEEW